MFFQNTTPRTFVTYILLFFHCPQVICSFGEGNVKIDLTPSDVNARTRVHEYGGVPYWIDQDGALLLGVKLI